MTDFDETSAPPPDEEPDEDLGEVVGSCGTIPPGEYVVRYLYHATGFFQTQPKVTVYCAVVEDEEFASIPLERFYNVISLKGPPRRFGGFRAPARGNLYREMSALLGSLPRRDRVSLRRLQGKRILCEVETVVNDGNRQPIPLDQQYSRIKRFIQILPDYDW